MSNKNAYQNREITLTVFEKSVLDKIKNLSDKRIAYKDLKLHFNFSEIASLNRLEKKGCVRRNANTSSWEVV